MTDLRAEPEDLAGRLQEAAVRLKERHGELAGDAAPASRPDPDPGAQDIQAPGVTLARLEEAGAAVRDARMRLCELESRLRAS